MIKLLSLLNEDTYGKGIRLSDEQLENIRQIMLNGTDREKKEATALLFQGSIDTIRSIASKFMARLSAEAKKKGVTQDDLTSEGVSYLLTQAIRRYDWNNPAAKFNTYIQRPLAGVMADYLKDITGFTPAKPDGEDGESYVTTGIKKNTSQDVTDDGFDDSPEKAAVDQPETGFEDKSSLAKIADTLFTNPADKALFDAVLQGYGKKDAARKVSADIGTSVSTLQNRMTAVERKVNQYLQQQAEKEGKAFEPVQFTKPKTVQSAFGNVGKRVEKDSTSKLGLSQIENQIYNLIKTQDLNGVNMVMKKQNLSTQDLVNIIKSIDKKVKNK